MREGPGRCDLALLFVSGCRARRSVGYALIDAALCTAKISRVLSSGWIFCFKLPASTLPSC